MTNVIEQRKAEVAEVCRRAEVQRLDVFGSAVQGKTFADFVWGVVEADLAPLVAALDRLLAVP